MKLPYRSLRPISVPPGMDNFEPLVDDDEDTQNNLSPAGLGLGRMVYNPAFYRSPSYWTNRYKRLYENRKGFVSPRLSIPSSLWKILIH